MDAKAGRADLYRPISGRITLQPWNYEGARRRSCDEVSSQPAWRSLGTGKSAPPRSCLVARSCWQHVFLVSWEHCCLPTSSLYGEDVLHATSTRTGILQAAAAIGIGFSNLAAGYLSSGKVEYGLTPLGSVGMTVLGILGPQRDRESQQSLAFRPRQTCSDNVVHQRGLQNLTRE